MERRLAEIIEVELGSAVVQSRPVAGGDFATAFRVTLDDDRTVFVKTHKNPPPGFFTTEATGLEWLRSSNSVNVPQVLAVRDEPALLILQWVDSGGATATTEPDLGRALAALHQSGAMSFGREDQRTTGSQALPNDPAETWAEFYATQRLLPLADIAERWNALPDQVIANLCNVAGRLSELTGPAEAPARLHGDLWAGNRMVDSSGGSWLIDPACFGGHREFDLAMMQLFGGFGSQVFAAYDEVFPLADGWRDRVALNQIAPLVVHAIKFSGGYVSAATDAITRYA
ncbi:MAG TPA: fructosamine kinase family protein [Microthrixaceae bacterium]|nr:fructosamine kinase family protein [Microthrixaceae bacterium]